MSLFLAYRPFLDPLPLNNLWFLLIVPISFGVALAYKAVRVPDVKMLGRQVLVLAVQIIVSMAGLGMASYLLVQHIAPLILPKS